MASNFVRNNPSITAALEKNIMEHISLMAQEQVQLEFPQEMQMLPQLQQAWLYKIHKCNNSYNKYLKK